MTLEQSAWLLLVLYTAALIAILRWAICRDVDRRGK